MGFSVSGSFAILILASFIAFGMLHSAGANSFELVSDATDRAYEDDLDRRNTAICIVHLSVQGNFLNVNVTNTGTTELPVDATDVVIDGVYHGVDDAQQVRVDGDPNTELWLPGQVLWMRFQVPSEPDRVKVVTEHGISDWELVPTDGCDGDGGGGGGGGGGDTTTSNPVFLSATAEITDENPQGVGQVNFTWETNETATLEFTVYDENGNVVGQETISDAPTSGSVLVDVTDGSHASGREPRPIVAEAKIVETGETCSRTIEEGDGDGPFQLC